MVQVQPSAQAMVGLLPPRYRAGQEGMNLHPRFQLPRPEPSMRGGAPSALPGIPHRDVGAMTIFYMNAQHRPQLRAFRHRRRGLSCWKAHRR